MQGHGLDHFVLTDDGPPEPILRRSILDDPNSSSTDLSTWTRQYRLISSWLLGSMTEAVLQDLLDCTSARQIWTTLEGTYVTSNLTKSMGFQKSDAKSQERRNAIKRVLFEDEEIGRFFEGNL